MFRGALVTRMHGFLAIHYWSATISTFNLGCLMYQQNLLILKTISFLIQEYWINWTYGNAKPTRSLNTNSCVCKPEIFFLAPTIWSDHRSLLHPVIARLQRPCNHSAIWWWHRWSCKWWWWSNDGVSCMQPAKPVPWVRSPYQVHWIGQTESNCNGLQCVWRSFSSATHCVHCTCSKRFVQCTMCRWVF